MSFFSAKTSGKLTQRGPQLFFVVLKSVVERKGFGQWGAKPIILNWAEKGHLVPLHLNLQHNWFKPPRTPSRCLPSAHSQADKTPGEHSECVKLQAEKERVQPWEMASVGVC